MPDQSGEPAMNRRKGAVFAHSEAGRVDVRPLVSAVEVVPTGMVLGVMPSPVCVGREGYQATNPARDIISAAGSEEGAMAAIVLDNERADDEAGRGKASAKVSQIERCRPAYIEAINAK
jgi:hypothetical protein